MKLDINNNYNGFKVIEERELREINAKGYVFEHEKSGARLIKILSDDDNKVFSIGFRTPPNDSTGLPHILEHSVLCGSRKFDTKEPFVELLKGSLNTFLNAMTFPDKTIYPVASRNEKDFFNLMDVYLDAVLYPSIYKYPEIFMQEGWYYNLESKDGELTYNGVVYNEMKGAYSSPDSLLYRNVPKTLFPNTAYRESSGGDPEVIPELTYKNFIEFHKKYYHPSNSYILLYGNGDLTKELQFINENYLKDFDKINVDSEIKTEKPFDAIKEHEFTYGISEDDSLENKTYLNLNFVVGEAKDSELYLAFEILTHLLLKTPAAPIKKALLDKGIGKAISGEFNCSIKQPIFSIIAKGCNLEQKEEFKNVVFSTFRDLVEKGIDKELIEASINKTEFELREGDFEGYPKGLVYYIRMMDSWLYEGDPFSNLQYNNLFDKIKEALKSNYFEQLIEKYILSNSHSSLIVLKPEKGANEKKATQLKEKLNNIKASLSEKELEEIIERGKKLKERQGTPDSPEKLAVIPLLSLDDIDKKAEVLPLEEKEEDGVKMLYHQLATNKIAYLNLYFNTKTVPQSLIHYIRLLSDILGKISTSSYDYGTLSNQINIHTGGIAYNPTSYSISGKQGEFNPYFIINVKALMSNLKKAGELIAEIIKNSNFDDNKRLFQLVKEIKARIEGRLIDNGHRIALRKVLSYCSSKGAYDEELLGLSYYTFLSRLEKEFEEKREEIISNLKNTAQSIFNKNNIIVSFSCDKEEYINIKEVLPIILNSLGSDKLSYREYNFNLGHKNEGLLTQGNVQYVAKGGNYLDNGHKYGGGLNVLESILGFDYLWNNVRVKGGAYGVFANFRRDGGAYIVSYRDPSIKETLKVYDGIEDYLNQFKADEREMSKYIIGTIRKLDHPLTNSMKGEVATSYYLSNITQDDVQKEREEVLSVEVNTIRNFAPLVGDLMKQNYICVLGNEGKLKENSDIFNELKKVID